MQPKDTKELRDGLSQFTGTEHWFRHIAPSVLYTEGVSFLAEKAEAYWLIDEIAFAQRNPKIKVEDFQVWKLTVNHNDMNAILTCGDGGKDGNENKIVYEKRIEFTDFPLDEIELWVGLDNILEQHKPPNRVIMLPSEY